MVYIGELNLYTNKKFKERAVEVCGKYLAINMLKNNSISEAMNPVLLLDFNQSLNQAGGQSYFDYLGLVQVLSLDLFEMRYV